SPLIGGLTLEIFPWQALFFLMLLFGLVVMAATWFGLPETNRYRDPANFHPRRLFGNYWELMLDLRFVRQGLILGLSLGAIYTMATVVPFVMIEEVGLTPAEFGLAMLMQS